MDQLDALVLLEGLDHLVRLVETHQAGVDVDAHQLVADGLVDHGGGDGGVDPAREGADHLAVADLGPDGLDRRVDDRPHRPVRLTAGLAPQELLEHRHAVGRVDHLGVELHPVHLAIDVLVGGDRGVGRGGGGHEARGQVGDGVEVAHPHDLLVGDAVVEERGVHALDLVQHRAAVLAPLVAADHAAELLGNELGSVANAQDGNAELVDGGIEPGRVLDVDRGRPAGQDDGGRGLGRQRLGGDVVGHDLGIDPQLADSASDQLRVLGAEVDDEHDLIGAGGGCRPADVLFAHEDTGVSFTINSAFCRSFTVS